MNPELDYFRINQELKAENESRKRENEHLRQTCQKLEQRIRDMELAQYVELAEQVAKSSHTTFDQTKAIRFLISRVKSGV